MKVGTKSLLFGIHQVFIHPYVVYKAWKFLYGRPTWREFVCIFIHDWGYWGRPDLDGESGVDHPKLGASIAYNLFSKVYGKEYYYLCSGHSRTYAKMYGFQVSKLCWADKLSFCFENRRFYLFRAKLSGELKLVREESDRQGIDTGAVTDKVLYDNIARAIRNIPEIKELLLKKLIVIQRYMWYIITHISVI